MSLPRALADRLHPPHRRGRRQRGAALITALLLAALAAVMVSGMLWRQWGAIQREQAARQSEQARWLLRGAVDWARLILREAANNTQIVALDQPWAVPLAEANLDEFLAAGQQDSLGRVWLEGHIVDAQARFNLTDLASAGAPNPDAVEALQRLCGAVGASPSLAGQLAQAVAAAQAPKASVLPIRELQDLARVSPAIAAELPRLAPYVTVLPTATPVNANTAGAQVLAAVLGIDAAQATQLLARRAQQHFGDLQAIAGALGQSTPLNVNATLVSVSSSYFEAVARVRIGGFEYAEQALIQRLGGLTQVLRMQRVAPWLAAAQSSGVS